MNDPWTAGDRYEPFIGRWSRQVAPAFLAWLEVADDSSWLDVGAGTGALSEAILREAAPASVRAVEPAPAFLAHAVSRLSDAPLGAVQADAVALPFVDDSFDAVVSGLVLNFVPDAQVAVSEMLRVAHPGGTVAAYVWDYAEGMQLLRIFWDAAAELDPGARVLDEGLRFPLCRPDALRACFEEVGAVDLETRAIDVPTPFRDFDDYWSPFLGGQGPASGYCMSLDETRRDRLREATRAKLPIEPDGSILLTARAWAVRGRASAG
jgi:SAM-dependent methyltransferase